MSACGSWRISFCRHSRQMRWPSSQLSVMPSPAENSQTAQFSAILEKLSASCTSCFSWGLVFPDTCSRASFSAAAVDSAQATMAQRPWVSFTMSTACLNSWVWKTHQHPPAAGTSQACTSMLPLAK